MSDRDWLRTEIGGADLAEDLRRIEAVLEVLGGDGSRLAVDVNGRFDLDTALAYGRAIDPYGLFWYEEVGDPLDYHLNATLAEHYRGPIATGENLFSLQDARNLVRYGGLRPDRTLLLRIDPAVGLARISDRPADRLEQEDLRFFAAIAQAYDELAAAEPERIVVIDAGQSPEAVLADALAAL